MRSTAALLLGLIHHLPFHFQLMVKLLATCSGQKTKLRLAFCAHTLVQNATIFDPVSTEGLSLRLAYHLSDIDQQWCPYAPPMSSAECAALSFEPLYWQEGKIWEA